MARRKPLKLQRGKIYTVRCHKTAHSRYFTIKPGEPYGEQTHTKAVKLARQLAHAGGKTCCLYEVIRDSWGEPHAKRKGRCVSSTAKRKRGR